MTRTGHDDRNRRSPGRRGDGEGGISQHRTGAWRGWLTVGDKPDGAPEVREVYGRTRAEVRKKLRALRQRQETGLLGDDGAERPTVAAFLTRWIAAAKGAVRPRTWQRYDELIRLHVLPTLGKQRLDALRPDHLQRLYADKLASGLAPRTVHHLHCVLHRALHQAVRWGYLPHNVVEAVDAPRVPRAELPIPTASELRRFLDAAEAAKDPLAALWLVAVYSGCREGELLGLSWQDVHLDAGAISIRRTLIGASGSVPQFGEPNMARSRRTVTLSAGATAALRLHRQRQLERREALGPDYGPYDLVFATGAGAPLLVRNVVRSFKAALRRAELSERVRFHDLRRASAALMLAAGVHPKVVSERLGHSAIGFTLNLHTHLAPGLDADAATRLERALDPAADPDDEEDQVGE